MTPLGEVLQEVTLTRLGSRDALHDRIWIYNESAVREEVLNIGRRLLDIALDIHREPRCFGNRQTEIEGNASGNAAKADEDSPHGVNRRGVERIVA